MNYGMCKMLTWPYTTPSIILEHQQNECFFWGTIHYVPVHFNNYCIVKDTFLLHRVRK